MKYIALSLMLLSFSALADSSLNLTWTTPEFREDGTQIESLDGYRIYHSIDNIAQPVISVSAGDNDYRVEDVIVGVYTFQISSVEAGLEGRQSDPVTKTITEIQASAPSQMIITISLDCNECGMEIK